MTDATTDEVARGFSETAGDYDEAVRFNIMGARRLVGSLPDRRYERVLDVGCGTGFASAEMVGRFAPTHITGVDPAGGMLEGFRAKLGGFAGTEIELHEADVESMPVPEAGYDAVISSMAFHWFPRKAEATRAMARALRPGGDLAVLCSGRGGEHAFRLILSRLEPPLPHWVGAFDTVQRDIPEMELYLQAAGLDPLDIWMERRIRRTSVEAYLERMRVVAGHLSADLPAARRAELERQVAEAVLAASGPRGFEYEFCKLFALARRPA
jgi:ubiquinone/menaquinone biosynthesis C-methylase UbiE